MRKIITKGFWSYEIQILMVVFNWAHDMEFYKNYMVNFKGLHIGRLTIWIDEAWYAHEIPARIRMFFRALFVNTDRFKSRRHKIHVVWINAKCMFRRWRKSISQQGDTNVRKT